MAPKSPAGLAKPRLQRNTMNVMATVRKWNRRRAPGGRRGITIWCEVLETKSKAARAKSENGITSCRVSDEQCSNGKKLFPDGRSHSSHYLYSDRRQLSKGSRSVGNDEQMANKCASCRNDNCTLLVHSLKRSS
jgi:hypothetical protein